MPNSATVPYLLRRIDSEAVPFRIPLFALLVPDDAHEYLPLRDPWDVWMELRSACSGDEQAELWRGVSLERLEAIARHGIDVEPSTAHFFVSYFDKALEYGGLPKVLMGFSTKGVLPTHQEFAADDIEQIHRAMETYPTRLTSEDGTRVWLSRLPAASAMVSSLAEVEYARWIPGDPWDVLRVLIFVVRQKDALEALTCALSLVMKGSTTAPS